MARRDEFVVGLDVGTQRVRAVVGEHDEKGIQITGIGQAEGAGLKGGMVVNIESTTRAIQRAIDDAARMAGCDIARVHVSVGGQHLEGTNSQGVVAIKDGEVRIGDRDRVLDAAQAVKLSPDREFLQMLPQKYCVDDTDGVQSPIGITGVRLEARVHLITAAQAAVQNLRRCVEQADLEIADLIASPLAASDAVLYDDEKELGVAMVDLGAGTTDVAIWHDDALVHTAVLPFGGNHVTSDVAFGLRTPKAEAERIKCRHGSASLTEVDEDEMIDVPSVGGRPPQQQTRQFLAEIIEPRITEILEHIRDEIRRSGYQELLASGVVMTGGTANLLGTKEVAEDTLGMPVRFGSPNQVGGLKDMVADPSFAAAVGLVKYGFIGDKVFHLDTRQRSYDRGNGLFPKIWASVQNFGQIFF